MNRYVSEMIGTMILVLMGCGSAVFAGDMPGAVTTGVGTPWVVRHSLRAVGGRHGIRYWRNIRMPYKSGDHTGHVLLGRNGGARMPCYTLFSR